MSFEKHKQLLNQELDQFNALLGELLPRYVLLVRKNDCTPEELKELGEIEGMQSIRRTVGVAIPFKNLANENIERIKQGLEAG